MLNPLNVKWIKSVTRDNGKAWAYTNYNLGDTFLLNFSKNPKWYPTNYLKAKPGEIIVLFQSMLQTLEYPAGWYMTHLITPLDNHIDKIDNTLHPYVRLVGVVGKPRNSNPINNEWSLYKCNRGQICKIDTIENKNRDLTILQKQEFISNLFEIDTHLLENLSNIEFEQIDFYENGVEEGSEKTKLKLHKYKERNADIIIKAKNQASLLNKLYCEVCSFNFADEYPNLGEGFIECHHKNPIATGGIRITKVEDLAIVCSNCHRMLHRKNNIGKYYSVDELKSIIKNKI
ncbi:HNH endonuclease [Flavobacterium chilense]|uniref:HNH endonuclease n=1 Tax=Flavobacterium chilense TaxID=946677 RepID=A0A1M7CIC1_9FLAO|nr:HNH endonuclease [Flavobacterium chilense]SHL67031.1 HNH endonuclease [Flavobacterium chilense]